MLNASFAAEAHKLTCSHQSCSSALFLAVPSVISFHISIPHFLSIKQHLSFKFCILHKVYYAETRVLAFNLVFSWQIRCLSALLSTPSPMKASCSHELNAFIKVPQDGRSSFLLLSPFYIATINSPHKNPVIWIVMTTLDCTIVFSFCYFSFRITTFLCSLHPLRVCIPLSHFARHLSA